MEFLSIYVIQHLKLENIILVGHDVGGMIAYSFLRFFPENLSKVVIMDTAIPGVSKSRHFTPEENPREVAMEINCFIKDAG